MIRLFRQYVSPRRMIFILGEGVLIYFSVTLAALLLMWGDKPPSTLLETIWAKVLVIAVVTQLTLYFNDLYEFENNDNTIELATRLIQSIGMTSIILAVIYFFLPITIVGRWIFLGSIIFLLFFLTSWRFLYVLVIKKRLFTEKSIILGTGDLAFQLLKEVSKRRDISYEITSVILHKELEGSTKQFDDIPVHYGFDGICEMAYINGATSIIVALDQKRGILPYNQLLNCKLKGLSVIDGESFYERITGKLLVEKITPSWLIFSEGFGKPRTSKITKRFVGLAMSFLLLTMLSPIILLIAIAVKLDSRGPVIFSQERVGENEAIFVLRKFRSMKCDAEEETGPVWACKDDPRVTRVGKIIRKLRLDELPQLWNVLNGDISFVGPRPERPFFVEKLKKIVPYYKERFSVKPGITGWAQVKYGYGASEKDALEKLKYDLYYIKNMSGIMDLTIIFHTVKIVLLGRGAR